MTGITILDRDERGLLKPTLRDLLLLLRETACRLSWSAAGVEAVGANSVDAAGSAGPGGAVMFEELLGFAGAFGQVIDGEFIGRSPRGDAALVIQAVDSTAFDVEGPEPVLNAIEAAYRRTRRYC